MNVRLMEEKDIPFVAPLLAYCENQSAPRGSCEQSHLDMATAFADPSYGYCLVVGDVPVGCVLAKPIDDDVASVGFLTVLPQLRAKRLSLALIDAVVMMLAAKGYSTLLMAHPNDAHWHGIYSRLGFKPVLGSVLKYKSGRFAGVMTQYRARMDDVLKGLLSVKKENSLWSAFQIGSQTPTIR